MFADFVADLLDLRTRAEESHGKEVAGLRISFVCVSRHVIVLTRFANFAVFCFILSTLSVRIV